MTSATGLAALGVAHVLPQQAAGLLLPGDFWGDLGASFASTAFSGSLLLAVPVALLAGLVSFASPCVLPLVPGYLGYLGGMSGATVGSRPLGGGGARARPGRRRVLGGVALFVAGFSLVFVVFGALAGSLGGLLKEWQDPISRVLGVVVILMGIAFMGFVPFLQQERRIHVSPRAGLWGAPLLGLVFGLGWAPCIGPTLTAITALSLDGGSAGRGALLSVAFCVGLGLPFVVIALGFESSTRVLGLLRRHRLAVMRAGGVMLVVLGVALVTGLWGSWAHWLQGVVTGQNGFVPVV